MTEVTAAASADTGERFSTTTTWNARSLAAAALAVGAAWAVFGTIQLNSLGVALVGLAATACILALPPGRSVIGLLAAATALLPLLVLRCNREHLGKDGLISE